MKYRSDFVTNSSSSSFVVAEINSKTLAEIISKFKDELEKEYTSILNKVDGDLVSLSAEDYIGPPENVSEIVNVVAQLFCYEVYIPGTYEDKEEDEEAREEFEEILEDEEYGISAIIAKEIINNKEAIEADLENFRGEFSEFNRF